ncbi:MAG: 2-phospho-L-lactate guanylyltransferase [Actinobacteria bacterium]|nr:2-phospho-L-lactate guanylyltransferase [Actinomycetota bacterium]MCL5445446.1 2-phospho-L-lactate guanylyltransferase [Actinomycetota bacterium]
MPRLEPQRVVAETARSRAVIVPIKPFSKAKRRLSSVLSDEERISLVHEMAERVIAAAHPMPVIVACEDVEVANWAEGLGATAFLTDANGLSAAVSNAVSHAGSIGIEEVTVAHGDLPHATGLAQLPEFDGVTLVPDRSFDGTTVIRIQTSLPFEFSYGPGSFRRHKIESKRLGVATLVLTPESLRFDVDTPEDLKWV